MVRRGETSDISKMAEIYCQAMKEAYKDILPKDYLEHVTIEEAKNIWKNFIEKRGNLCLLWEEYDILGFAGIKEDEEKKRCTMLSSLYVAKDVQGRGIGRRLIEEVFQEARKRGSEFVSVSVVMKNERAKNIYEGLGAKYEKSHIYHFGIYPVQCRRYLWNLDGDVKGGTLRKEKGIY